MPKHRHPVHDVPALAHLYRPSSIPEILDLIYAAYLIGIQHALSELKTVHEVGDILNERSTSRINALAREIGAGTIVGRDRLYTPEDVRRMQERHQTDKRYVESPKRPRRKEQP